MKFGGQYYFTSLFIALNFTLLYVPFVFAQSGIKPPDDKKLFTEDIKAEEVARRRAVKSALTLDPPASSDLDFKAPDVEFLREENIIRGSGGVIISQSGTIAQSERAEVNLETKDSILEGNVGIKTSSASLSADKATFNFDTEVGDFESATVILEEGGYKADAEKAHKVGEIKYNFFDSRLTTCHCADGSTPWQINSSKTNVTQESYAHCYNTSVEFQGLPVFYTPYLAFPVKTKRQSGLLVPEYGYSSRDGVMYKQPIFAVVDDSTDFTFTPFTQTRTRTGSEFDFRKYFSSRSKIDSRIIYSNETARDGELRGTRTQGVFDPEIDDHRFLGYYRQIWKNEPGADIPLQYISNIRYISDDLALREFDDDQIGEAYSRYLTSQVVFRAGLSDSLSASLEGEYNQFIDQDDDLGFQRLPQFGMSYLRSFRPFGYNPLGARLVTRAQFAATHFVRETGYDGYRTNFTPSFTVPFHYKNYFSSSVGVGLRYTTYSLNSSFDPRTELDLDDSNDRAIANVSYAVSTAVERVYGLDEDSWLVYLTSLGKNNQANRLRRVKHTVEPFLRYNYVPFTNQSDLPFFDSTDRIRQRSLFTYGFSTNLYGRFLPLSGSEQKITELTPRVEELPDLNIISALPDMGSLEDYRGLAGSVSSRRGEIRNLASLTVKQSYDYVEDKKNLQENISPYSDVGSELSVFPTRDFALSVQNQYNAEAHSVSYWALGTHLRTDRGDNIKARYTFRNDVPEQNIRGTSQLEGNIELLLSERFRFGFYSLYDEKESEFIRTRTALRMVSACNCWHFDVGFLDKTNPDKQQVFLTFTFTGLGDISQRFGVYESGG